MRILIVDDHPLVRKGIISLLENQEEKNIFFEASDLNEAEFELRTKNPEIALVDINLGNKQNGIELVRISKKMEGNYKFVILSSYISQSDYEQAEKLGVNGFILKDALAEDIMYALNLVRRGQKYYSPAILEMFREPMYKDDLKLTKREIEVLKKVVVGKSNQGIAEDLYISRNTVKKHMSSIFSKFDIKNRTELIYFINKAKIEL
ncbi:MAG: response regulator transcription factor [Clostridiales bacterium]